MNRRTFLQIAAAAAGSTVPHFAIGKPGKSANGKLNIAFIGSGGWIAQQPYKQGCAEENLVAFCDVDRDHCAENMKAWRTNQPFFDDFRVMLDKMHREIDAIVVSTPDHTHFAATQMAMERGIHVYTQKPLTHNIWQCRTLPEDVRKAWAANPPAKTIPRVLGGPFREWMRAIKGEGPEPGSNFSVSANLTEIILLGVLAQRFNTRIEWDSKAGRITNHPELNAIVKEPAREGWRFGETL